MVSPLLSLPGFGSSSGVDQVARDAAAAAQADADAALAAIESLGDPAAAGITEEQAIALIREGLAALDDPEQPAAGNVKQHSGASGNVTISQADFEGFDTHLVTDVSTPRDVTIAGGAGVRNFASSRSNTRTITVKRGTAKAIKINPGGIAQVWCDGTANHMAVLKIIQPVQTFTALDDAPSSLTPDALIGVNSGGTALENKTAAQVRAAAGMGAVALTASGGVVAIDAASGQTFRLTLDGNHEIADPTNLYAGWVGCIEITQGAGGGFVPTWGAAWTWPGGTPPTLSATEGAVDVIGFRSFDGATVRAVLAAADFS